jgi:hypothetical protein
VFAGVLAKNFILSNYEENESDIAYKANIDGKEEWLKETILDNLKELGNVPQNLIECINKQENMDILKYWNKIAVIAESLDEFEEKIKYVQFCNTSF